MVAPNLPTFDYREATSTAHACTPTLSSGDAGWGQIQLSLRHLPAHAVPEHTAEHHSICINQGQLLTMQATVDGKSKTVDRAPGAVGIFPAHHWQSFEWDQEAEFLDLYLEPALIDQTAAELGGSDGVELEPHLGDRFDPLIRQVAIALKQSLTVDSLSSRLYADSMASALAAHLVVHYSAHRPRVKVPEGGLPAQSFKRVIDYIDTHLDQNLSLADLARVAQLSPYHFARLFKQSTGMSPHRYHIHCRVEQAKQLLRAKQLSLAAIAHAVGFSSQGHFNYHFKRSTGLTPRAFLKQC
ncbi:MAG: helix-turn-helix domain-containing protein [Nodosilinea sp.]